MMEVERLKKLYFVNELQAFEILDNTVDEKIVLFWRFV